AEYGFELPRRLQIELARLVQEVTDASGKEIGAAEIHAILQREYLAPITPHRYVGHQMAPAQLGGAVNLEIELEVDGARRVARGGGAAGARGGVVTSTSVASTGSRGCGSLRPTPWHGSTPTIRSCRPVTCSPRSASACARLPRRTPPRRSSAWASATSCCPCRR